MFVHVFVCLCVCVCVYVCVCLLPTKPDQFVDWENFGVKIISRLRSTTKF